MVVAGLLLVIAHGGPSSISRALSLVIGQGRLYGCSTDPRHAILVVVGEILVRNSRFFRQSYYIGGNEGRLALRD
jgi:ribose transport system permease protein